MKDIDNVVFTDEILEKYKDDSKMITELCKKLDENKKVQEEYKKFLKGEEKLLHAYEKIKKENKQLKDELKNKPDNQITLQDDKGNKFILIQTERIDIQVELNKTIEKLFNNWNKLKEYIKKEGFEINTREYGSIDVIDKYAIIEKMRELEIGIGKDD